MAVFTELHAMERELETLTRQISELDHASAEYADVADRATATRLKPKSGEF
jgi:hypothetical protein